MVDHGVAAHQLRAFVERVERLEAEKKTIADDIKEVYGEAKGSGFDVKVIREIIKIRKQDSAKRQEFEAILDLYKHALGMASDADVDDDVKSAEPDDYAPPKPTAKDKADAIVKRVAKADPIGFDVGEGV